MEIEDRSKEIQLNFFFLSFFNCCFFFFFILLERAIGKSTGSLELKQISFYLLLVGGRVSCCASVTSTKVLGTLWNHCFRGGVDTGTKVEADTRVVPESCTPN